MARHLAGDLGNNVDIAGNPLHDYHCRRCCLPDAGLEAHPPRCPEANAVNLSFEAAEPAFEVAESAALEFETLVLPAAEAERKHDNC